MHAVSGMAWNMIERFVGQGIGFIVTLIMARLLTPDDYGLIAMLLIFIEIGNGLCDSGMTPALIREKRKSHDTFTTAFLFQNGVALCCYLIIWISAPLIADFFGRPSLTLLARILALAIPLKAIALIKTALLQIRLDFRTQALVSILSQIPAGILGIVGAITDLGVFAIAIYQLSLIFFSSLFLWIFGPRNHLGRWNSVDFNRLFKFGSRLMYAGMIDVGYRYLYFPLIGKFYPASTLGLFSRARQLASFGGVSLGEIMRKVSYPILCSSTDDNLRFITIFRQFKELTAYLYLPAVIILAVAADDIILLLLGQKWLPAAPMMRILAVGFMMYPLDVLNLAGVQSLGRSDIFLKVEIIKKIIGILLLVGSLRGGILMICAAFTLTSIIGYFLNLFVAVRAAGSDLLKELLTNAKILLTAIISAVAGYFTMQISGDSSIMRLCVLLCVSSGVYITINRAAGFRVDTRFRILLGDLFGSLKYSLSNRKGKNE